MILKNFNKFLLVILTILLLNSCKVNLDGKGLSKINTPIPFMNHMLEQISKHSCIDLDVKCSGDVEIEGILNSDPSGGIDLRSS